LKKQASFVKEPYKNGALLQKETQYLAQLSSRDLSIFCLLSLLAAAALGEVTTKTVSQQSRKLFLKGQWGGASHHNKKTLKMPHSFETCKSPEEMALFCKKRPVNILLALSFGSGGSAEGVTTRNFSDKSPLSGVVTLANYLVVFFVVTTQILTSLCLQKHQFSVGFFCKSDLHFMWYFQW